MVLRAFDASSRQITIHSDVRADKVAELRVKPAACAYFWDPSAQVQLRASGPASLLEGEAVRPEWDRLHPGSRMSYRAKPAPGSSLADPACLDLLPEAEAFRHFVVIRMEIQRLDWLRLSRDGQRRAAFDWKQGFIQTWLVP